MKRTRFTAVIAALMMCSAMLCSCADDNSSAGGTKASGGKYDTSLAAEDLDVGYDENSAGTVSFADGKAEVSGSGSQAEGAVVTISASGEYVVSGECSDGRIIINADKNAEIQLIFKGLELTCSDNAPVLISNADKVIITLEDGTDNVLTDGSSYALSGDENTDGCIFSKADLTINGSGSLTVNGNYKHGIVSKDDLVIADGKISVKAVKTALEGKDCVKISGGKTALDAGSNGIRSTNDEEEDKGYVSISGGEVSIECGSVAVSAVTFISAEGGSVSAVCGDDGLRSLGDISLSGADITIDSGDDAVNADNDITISAGSVSIMNSHEGFEAKTVTIDGGEISITAEDDGINCSGNKDDEDTGSAAQEGVCLTVNGGVLRVTSNGDGLDSNGDLIFNGGEVYLSVTENEENSALDCRGEKKIADEAKVEIQ